MDSKLEAARKQLAATNDYEPIDRAAYMLVLVMGSVAGFVIGYLVMALLG